MENDKEPEFTPYVKNCLVLGILFVGCIIVFYGTIASVLAGLFFGIRALFGL